MYHVGWDEDKTMMTETERVMDAVDVDKLTERLSGRGDGLRSSKPDTDADDGLTQYVWRMARFHSGADPCMPTTAAWWLQDWLDARGIDASVSGVTDDAGEEITEALDAVVDEVLDGLGHDSDAGAKRWKKAGAF